MIRPIAILTIIASFSCVAPAAATPCDLAGSFLGIHETIVDLALTSTDANAVSRHMHNSSRGRAYKDVETRWEDVKQRTASTLEKLNDILITLDAQREGEAKKYAEDLATAYQTSLRSVVNFARSAVYLERTENAVSMNRWTGYLNYSVPRAPAEVNTHNFAREQEEKYNGAGDDALRMLKLPEHLYGKECGRTFPALPLI